MTSSYRLVIQFSLFTASILLLFSMIIYHNSADYRHTDFSERLKRKARTTARLLIDVKEVNQKLLKIIDRNTESALIDSKVYVFNAQNKLIYSSTDERAIQYNPALLKQVQDNGEFDLYEGKNELVGIPFQNGNERIVILASAYDYFGHEKLRHLGLTLLWGTMCAIGLTAILVLFTTGWRFKAQLPQLNPVQHTLK